MPYHNYRIVCWKELWPRNTSRRWQTGNHGTQRHWRWIDNVGDMNTNHTAETLSWTGRQWPGGSSWSRWRTPPPPHRASTDNPTRRTRLLASTFYCRRPPSVTSQHSLTHADVCWISQQARVSPMTFLLFFHRNYVYTIPGFQYITTIVDINCETIWPVMTLNLDLQSHCTTCYRGNSFHRRHVEILGPERFLWNNDF